MLERAAKNPKQPLQRRIRSPDVAAIYQSPPGYEREIVAYVSSEDIQERIVFDEMEGKNAYLVRTTTSLPWRRIRIPLQEPRHYAAAGVSF